MNVTPRGTRHRKYFISSVALIAGLLAGIPFTASPTPSDVLKVRFEEGLLHGFFTVTDDRGVTIGDGEYSQIAEKDNLNGRLIIRFKDGSFFDDQTVFSQHGIFRLVSDHVVEKGASFKTPMDVRIDATSGEVTVNSTDSAGRQKTINKKMELPADLANGMVYTLVKDIGPEAPETTVSYVATTPQPRLVKLVFRRAGEATFMAGAEPERATHYVMSVVVGGVAGIVAPLIGKKPPDTDIWVLNGTAPVFARARGPLYGGGPVWTISLPGLVNAK